MSLQEVVNSRAVGWDRFREAQSVLGRPSAESDAPTSDELAQSRRDFATLQEARERFRDSVNAESKRRTEMLVDQRFRCGDQWEEGIRAIREAQKRPCLTINRIDGFLAHVLNELRQARPQIKVDPVGAGADEEIAEVRQGLIRHIEQASRCEVIYDTAFENMATMGLGYMRVVDQWSEDGGVFDQDLRIEWIANPFTVYEDPSARQPDWSDGRYKFVVEDLTLGEFQRQFGKENSPASLGEFKSIGDDAPMWIIGEKIRVAEYWHIEDVPDRWLQLDDGTKVYESQATEEELLRVVVDEEGNGTGRDTLRPQVTWTKLYGLGILKERKWKGKYIPIIPVIGNQIHVNGEQILVGMVRYAREAQRMFNYMYSCFVEMCALAPRATFLGAFDQLSEFEDSYKIANSSPQSVLYYRHISAEGNLIPPPQLIHASPDIGAFVRGLEICDQNLKSTFRIFEASLGEKGPQESGVAIQSRKIESDLATYNWIDNFSRGLKFLGIVLNDLIPYYYNTPGRIIQIIQEDLTKKPVTFNEPTEVDGEQKIYDLTKGKFGIVIGTGPNFATRRQEAAKSMMEAAKVIPIIAQAAPAQMIRAMDWPGKDQIADQVERALPPELRTKKEEGELDPEQLKQQLVQAESMIQQLSQITNALTEEKMAERMKMQAEIFKEVIRSETSLAIANLREGSRESQFLADKQFERLQVIEAQANPQNQPDGAAAKPQAPGPQTPPQGEGTPAVVGNG